MQIKTLKVFCDVVSRRSFSRAADENGISQSGVSQIVHQLEDHLGVKLLDRSKRPFLLTPEGEVYYEGCRKLVQRFNALEEEVRTLHDEVSGRVHIASIYSVGLSHVNDFVQRFLRQHPRTNVRIEYQHPDRVYELVEQDLVDLGLVSYPRSTRTLKAISWREEPMVLICAPDHPLAGGADLDPLQLSGVDFVGFDEHLKIRQETDKYLAALGVDIRLTSEFDNIETLKRAVEIGSGVSLVPEPSVTRERELGTLVTRPLCGQPLLRPVGIVHRRGAVLGKTARRFLQELLDSGNGAAAVDGGGRISRAIA